MQPDSDYSDSDNDEEFATPPSSATLESSPVHMRARVRVMRIHSDSEDEESGSGFKSAAVPTVPTGSTRSEDCSSG